MKGKNIVLYKCYNKEGWENNKSGCFSNDRKTLGEIQKQLHVIT